MRLTHGRIVNCNYTDYFFSRYYGTYTIVANGYRWSSPQACQYGLLYRRPLLTVKHSTSILLCDWRSLDEDITGGTHVEIYTSLPLTYVYGGGVNGSKWRAMFICTLKTAVRFSMCALVVTQIKDAKVNGNVGLYQLSHR